MLKVGDKVVCPTHGAGTVTDIAEMEIAGSVRDYFVITLLYGGMQIKIPVSDNPSGIRYIISAKEATDILDNFSDLDIEDISTNWSKRYRDNIDRIKSGEIMQIAKVLKCLMLRNKGNNLSAGERKMFQNAKTILVSELEMSLNESNEEIERRLYSAIE